MSSKPKPIDSTQMKHNSRCHRILAFSECGTSDGVVEGGASPTIPIYAHLCPIFCRKARSRRLISTLHHEWDERLRTYETMHSHRHMICFPPLSRLISAPSRPFARQRLTHRRPEFGRLGAEWSKQATGRSASRLPLLLSSLFY